MLRRCQVCGGVMFGYKDMGLDKDGTVNGDFCSSCYRFGRFSIDQ
ncbi:MAG: zinc ribbon domain-containing protein [Clostridiales bacterium]|nr:zinc ribbon domain-containing protein [Clostridiales bacterium]